MGMNWQTSFVGEQALDCSTEDINILVSENDLQWLIHEDPNFLYVAVHQIFQELAC